LRRNGALSRTWILTGFHGIWPRLAQAVGIRAVVLKVGFQTFLFFLEGFVFEGFWWTEVLDLDEDPMNLLGLKL
jgi:hypothetical protein